MNTGEPEPPRIPSSKSVHFLAQIAGSLREAHAKGLVHRDVKPSNVVVTERGGIADFVKLLDFGSSRRARRSPQANSPKWGCSSARRPASD